MGPHHMARGLPTDTARDLMSTEVFTCYEGADTNEAAHFMEEKGISRLPVFDRRDRLVGLLSLGDVSIHCPHALSGEVMEPWPRPATEPRPVAITFGWRVRRRPVLLRTRIQADTTAARAALLSRGLALLS